MNLDALVNEYDKKQMMEVEMQSRLGRRICKRVILSSWPPLAITKTFKHLIMKTQSCFKTKSAFSVRLSQSAKYISLQIEDQSMQIL